MNKHTRNSTYGPVVAMNKALSCIIEAGEHMRQAHRSTAITPGEKAALWTLMRELGDVEVQTDAWEGTPPPEAKMLPAGRCARESSTR